MPQLHHLAKGMRLKTSGPKHNGSNTAAALPDDTLPIHPQITPTNNLPTLIDKSSLSLRLMSRLWSGDEPRRRAPSRPPCSQQLVI
ncbi:hypothetical protein EYF80_025621 [Liparis tanakae]|uniref:Uncharacterized protein n=1 Tax=Liparis tanakae TaxID=230148 RepID=A0A4Z2HGN2_9TELE|nr:hypothetical protein EYF80_025621 [Liparis tanakae]